MDVNVSEFVEVYPEVDRLFGILVDKGIFSDIENRYERIAYLSIVMIISKSCNKDLDNLRLKLIELKNEFAANGVNVRGILHNFVKGSMQCDRLPDRLRNSVEIIDRVISANVDLQQV